MLSIQSPDLQLVYNNYLAIRNMVEYVKVEALRRTQQNFGFLSTISFPFIGDINNRRREETLGGKFQGLLNTLNDSSILSIVSEFERLVFIRISSSSGLISNVVQINYNSPSPMHNFGKLFVKQRDDIFNLSGFNKFLILHKELKEDLEEIINYRNYIAHGKRNDVGKTSNKTVEQIVSILDSILSLL